MKIFKPLKPRIKKSDLINENTRLHDLLKSLEVSVKVLKLAKETLEVENLKLHNKIIEHVRNSAAMQKDYLKEIEKLTRKRNSKGQYIK